MPPPRNLTRGRSAIGAPANATGDRLPALQRHPGKKAPLKRSATTGHVSTVAELGGSPQQLLPVKAKRAFGDKKLCGDIFGNNSSRNTNGLVYSSRCAGMAPPAAAVAAPPASPVRSPDSHLDGQRLLNSTLLRGYGSTVALQEEDLVVADLHPEQRLALTLRNWCATGANVVHMLDERAVWTLIKLAASPDPRTKSYCARAFHNLSGTPRHRPQMIREGMMQALVSLADVLKGPQADLVGPGFAESVVAAICNLTLADGFEAQLVSGGAVHAVRVVANALIEGERTINAASAGDACTDPHLLALAAQGDAVDVLPECTRALYNLTCVTENYPGLENVIAAIIALPLQSPLLKAQDVLVAACCNCSVFFKLRMRMIESGVVAAVGAVVTGSSAIALKAAADLATKAAEREEKTGEVREDEEVHASRMSDDLMGQTGICLHNIASARACRGVMIDNGVIPILRALSMSAKGPRSRSCIAATIQQLSLDVTSRKRLVMHGGVEALLKLVLHDNEAAGSVDSATAQYASKALQSLSEDDAFVVPMIELGAIEAFIYMCTADDEKTRQNVAGAFSNVMGVPAVQDAIVSSGALAGLLGLVENMPPGGGAVGDAVAFAIYNMACSCDTGIAKRLVDASIVKVLAGFVVAADGLRASATTMLCVAKSLCHLAAASTVDGELMIADGALRALTQMLDFEEAEGALGNGSDVAPTAAQTLNYLANDPRCHDEFVEMDLIPKVIAAALRAHDVRTRSSCCAVLASLSFSGHACQVMLEADGDAAYTVFKKMERIDDPAARLDCTTALCNLSRAPKARPRLVLSGIVPLLAALSNSYSELAQRNIATCMCNLSCDLNASGPMSAQGGLETLVMIALLRSGNTKTKAMCAQGMLNLFTPESLDAVINRDTILGLAELSYEHDEGTIHSVACMFRIMSCHKAGREEMSKNVKALNGLFSLMRSTDAATKMACGRAVCNLLVDPDTQADTAKHGGLTVIKVLATVGDPECEVLCANALAMMSHSEQTRALVYSSNAPPVLVYLMQSKRKASVLAAVRAVCCLAFYKKLRLLMIGAGVTEALVALIVRDRYQSEIMDECARTLCYLATAHDGRANVVTNNATLAVALIIKRSKERVRAGDRVGSTRRIEALCAMTLQYFSWCREVRAKLVDDGAMHLVLELIKHYLAMDRPKGGKPKKTADRVLEGQDLHDALYYQVMSDAVVALANLSRYEELVPKLVDAGAIEVAVLLTPVYKHHADIDGVWRIMYALFSMAKDVSSRARMVELGALTPLLELSGLGNAAARQCCAAALCHLARCREVRARMVEEGALKVLMALSEATEHNILTQHWCLLAISELSEESTIDEGLADTFLLLSKGETLRDEVRAKKGRTDAKKSNPLFGSKKIMMAQSKLRHMVNMGNYNADKDKEMQAITGESEAFVLENAKAAGTDMQQRLVAGRKKDAVAIVSTLSHPGTALKKAEIKQAMSVDPPSVETTEHLANEQDHDSYQQSVFSSFAQPDLHMYAKVEGGAAGSDTSVPTLAHPHRMTFPVPEEAVGVYGADTVIPIAFAKVKRSGMLSLGVLAARKTEERGRTKKPAKQQGSVGSSSRHHK